MTLREPSADDSAVARLDSVGGRDENTEERRRSRESRENSLRVLLAGCARQDHAAFERLYRITAPKLYSLCFEVLRRRELAEEVLQDVFAQIWREAPRFMGYRSAPMIWMTVMARNRAIDVLRRQANVVRPFNDEDDRNDPPEREPDPLAYAQRLDESEALRRCLERLQTRQREVILLAFYQGLTHSQLSETLAEPVGTVKSWIRRGLGQLKQCLEQ